MSKSYRKWKKNVKWFKHGDVPEEMMIYARHVREDIGKTNMRSYRKLRHRIQKDRKRQKKFWRILYSKDKLTKLRWQKDHQNMMDSPLGFSKHTMEITKGETNDKD